MSYLNIKKEDIPYKFDIRLIKSTYTIIVNYNADFDFFTVSVTDSFGKILTSGEKLVLNKEILSEQKYINFPIVKPIDLSIQENTITWGNFGKEVLLYVGDSNE